MPQNGDTPQKRLIVCCDGTWHDSTADSAQPPSNLTRFARALRQTAIVERGGEKKAVPQIMYYQTAAGTSPGDKFRGGVAGLGISANVRAAYGFLAHNYSERDEIFFFGFSRGAYTARAVAGLVCQLGLLTPRGMDNFTNVYHDFYEKQVENYSYAKRKRLEFRDPLPPFTVKIIGVWDTTGFQKPWLGKNSGEKLELRNTVLSPNVKYAFHALALDEDRTAYQPIMWHIPRKVDGQELLQVWFSGVHIDIGGGGDDPHLSNIPLAWMIAQCTKHGQLDFDVDYLFDIPPADQEKSASNLWATSLGKTSTAGLVRTMETILGAKSNRTPLAYNDLGHGSYVTEEKVHISIKNRHRWPCLPLKSHDEEGSWTSTGNNRIYYAPVLDMEVHLEGRIRTVHVDTED